MISVMAYVASFAISLGPIFWLLIAEIYPLRIRTSRPRRSLHGNIQLGFRIPRRIADISHAPLHAAGPSRTFWLYGFLTVVAWIFSYWLVPETKGKTLEEIESFWSAGHVTTRG